MYRTFIRRFATGAALVTVLGGSALATPVSYSESVSGDLDYGGRGPPSHLFVFDAGVNTITGTMAGSFPATGPSVTDLDGFQFSLGSNLRLDSVTVAYTFRGTPNNTSPDPAAVCSEYVLYSTGPRTQITANRALLLYTNACLTGIADVTSGGALWTTALPLTNGTWEVSNNALTTAYGGGYVDYTYSFNVTPVPVPGAAWLFGGALALLGVARRRSVA